MKKTKRSEVKDLPPTVSPAPTIRGRILDGLAKKATTLPHTVGYPTVAGMFYAQQGLLGSYIQTF